MKDARHLETGLALSLTEMGRNATAMDRHISLKYRFHEEELRQQFITLILRIMNTFAELQGAVPRISFQFAREHL